MREMVSARNVAFYCYNRDFGMAAPRTDIERTTYSFLRMRSWKDAMGDAFFEIGGHSLGIDYRENALVLRTSDPEAAIELMDTHSIPPDAYRVVEDSPVELAYVCPSSISGGTLNSCFRPVPGGVEFESTNNGGTASDATCTVTAATDRYIVGPNYWQSGFVTASHCMNPMWSNGSRWAHQFRWNDGMYFNMDLVGVEYADPSGWSCGSYTCRYSDSSWIYHTQGGVQHGTIAQTVGLGSKVMSTAHPRFYIWGAKNTVQGQQVEKIGKTTGWTTGVVTQVCADEIVGNKRIKCSARTSLGPNVGADSGDSGAPVFYWWWFYGVDTVEMVGLLYGKNAARDVGVFSPWSGVEADLGSLYIQYPYF